MSARDFARLWEGGKKARQKAKLSVRLPFEGTLREKERERDRQTKGRVEEKNARVKERGREE